MERMALHPRLALRVAAFIGWLFGALLLVSCSKKAQQPAMELDYPKPRYPRYLVNPTADQLLEAARFAVSQPEGRCPLGKVQSGQDAYVTIMYGQEMKVWDAIAEAWAEKGVKAHALGYWEIMGMSEEEYDKRMEANVVRGDEGWKEPGIFIRRDFRKYYPADIQKQFGDPISDFDVIDPYLLTYLDKHPEIQHIFMGNGGPHVFQQYLGRHGKKYEGNWIYIRSNDLLTKAAEYPPDVWSLGDEKILRPHPVCL